MAYWLWYPGDFEIYHGMLQNMQREERGYGWPAYWKMDDWRKHVLFRRELETDRETSFRVHTEGIGHVRLDGTKYPFDREICCPAGKHLIEIDVGNMSGLPAVYVEGEVVFSSLDWAADDFEESHPAGWSPLYQNPDLPPSAIPCQKLDCQPVSISSVRNGTLFDFGREINGEVTLRLRDESARMTVAYGESEEEALNLTWCYYRENGASSGQPLRKRAFRYLFIPEVSPEEAACEAVHEEFPLEVKAAFHSDQALINQIWDTARETFHLCSGLFFIDGVKRDRWIWSGDAYQSYFVNQYLFFDEEINKRTIRALRGNTPIVQHLNTIVDYSMLWLISLENHYWMTGDSNFLREMYPKMQAMMDLLEGQRNEHGFLYGRRQDWVYIDWADLDRDGVLCAEQILLWKSFRTMAFIAEILGEPGETYRQKAEELRENIQQFFWCEEKHAFIDTYETGRCHVTRHANILAILFGMTDQDQTEEILKHVLLNEEIPAITTPYFKFFELDMWGKMGRLDLVWTEIQEYWGGMLAQGAKTFWEAYDPQQKGDEHYAMYGDPFGKSLCHAWAASPIYLLGRYFLGVRPISPGYQEFVVEPHLEMMNAGECVVPVRDGTVKIVWGGGKMQVTSTRPGGVLIWNGVERPIPVC